MQAEISREHPHQREHEHRDPLGVDAGEFGGFGIAADRVDITAEAGARRNEGHHDAGGERDQHGNRVARRDEQPALGHDDIVRCRLAFGDPFRPGIIVDHPGRAERDETAYRRERQFRPHRALRKIVARAPPAAGIEAGNDADAAQHAQGPARHRADRAERAAAHQREPLVERRDRRARRHPPGRAAPEQLSAERDDEGGDAEIGDQRSVESPDRRADREARRRR